MVVSGLRFSEFRFHSGTGYISTGYRPHTVKPLSFACHIYNTVVEVWVFCSLDLHHVLTPVGTPKLVRAIVEFIRRIPLMVWLADSA